MKLKIYSDPAFASPKNPTFCAMLSPFFGEAEGAFWSAKADVFAKYRANSGQYFETVDTLEAADFAVLPSTYHRYLSDNTQDVAFAFAKKVAEAGKQLIVFHERDYDFKFPFPNAVLFSPTIEGKRGKRDFGLPAWVPDHLDGPGPVRPKQDKPVVGFCGWVPSHGLKDQFRRFAKMYLPVLSEERMGGQRAPLQPNFRYKFLRAQSVARLQNDAGVTANFVLRNQFFGGAVEQKTEEEREAQRVKVLQEYLDNLSGSDYSLCVRGIGNYSLRFYETLAAGRIPLFLDTDCTLPYHFDVEWRRELAWVDKGDHSKVGRKLADFHAAETAEGFEDRQKRMREIWEDRLSPDGFFRNFHRHFVNGEVRTD